MMISKPDLIFMRWSILAICASALVSAIALYASGEYAKTSQHGLRNAQAVLNDARNRLATAHQDQENMAIYTNEYDSLNERGIFGDDHRLDWMEGLERIRQKIALEGLDFATALEYVAVNTIFTTHTPVPAGFDMFTPELMDKYFSDYVREVGISREELLALGRSNAGDPREPFNMAALALRSSAHANAVSALHGEVSRGLLTKFFPSVPQAEVPVGHVTNGIHTRTWVSREMALLFDRYLGPEWWRRPGEPATWKSVDDIPDEELWATHERRRERLVTFARRRLMRQLEQRGSSDAEIGRARGVLNSRALTIGFARRFAPYKRATLLLRDLDRLKKILLNAERPVQIIFAGKAHPRDTEGKEILKTVFAFCHQEDVRRNAVFLDDYDLVVARYLVQGVDVWLNTPRRKLEASGTSGMKVVANGGLNLSILDGWWVEGYRPEVGWAIGRGEDYTDHNYQNYVESNALYDILENDVVPLFYDRQADSLPRGWIARMKKSLRMLCPAFSTNRMLWEYSERYYLPAARYYTQMTENGMERARQVVQWKRFLQEHWGEVNIQRVEAVRNSAHRVGEGYELTAEVHLGAIDPKDVSVEAYYGPLNAERQITEPAAIPMRVRRARTRRKYFSARRKRSTAVSSHTSAMAMGMSAKRHASRPSTVRINPKMAQPAATEANVRMYCSLSATTCSPV